MIIFFSFFVGVISSLSLLFLTLAVFLSPVLNEKTVLIISIFQLLCVCRSPFFHLLNRPSRQADLFTGVHSVLKEFKHHWTLWRGQSSREWIHDTHSIPLQVSSSQYTLCYNRNTRVFYPPRFITSWLRPVVPTRVWILANIYSTQSVTVERYLCIINQTIHFFLLCSTSLVSCFPYYKAHIVWCFMGFIQSP